MRRKVFWRMWCLRQERASLPQGSMNDISPTKGKKYHHILDPYTGFPADTGLASVTILSDTSAQGDALSTTCFLLGIEKGMALVEQLDDVEASFHYDGRRTHSVFRLFKLSGTAIKDLKRTTEEKVLPWSFPPLPHSYEKIFFLNKNKKIIKVSINQLTRKKRLIYYGDAEFFPSQQNAACTFQNCKVSA